MLMALPGQFRAQPVGEDLHVAGQNHQLHLVLGDQQAQRVLGVGLGVAAVTGMWWNGMR